MRMVASVVSFLLRHRSGYRNGGVHVLKTVIVMCCFVLTGCASAQILHDKQQARLYADLQQDKVLLKKFRECSFRPYGEPSNAVTGDAEPREAEPAPSVRPLQMLINNSTLSSDEDIAGLLQVISDLADPSQITLKKVFFRYHRDGARSRFRVSCRLFCRVQIRLEHTLGWRCLLHLGNDSYALRSLQRLSKRRHSFRRLRHSLDDGFGHTHLRNLKPLLLGFNDAGQDVCTIEMLHVGSVKHILN